MSLDPDLLNFYNIKIESNHKNIIALNPIGLRMKANFHNKEILINSRKPSINYYNFFFNKYKFLGNEVYNFKITLKQNKIVDFVKKFRIDIDEPIFSKYLEYLIFDERDFNVLNYLDVVCDPVNVLDENLIKFKNYSSTFDEGMMSHFKFIDSGEYLSEKDIENLHTDLVKNSVISDAVVHSSYYDNGCSCDIYDLFKYNKQNNKSKIKDFKININADNEHNPIAIIDKFKYKVKDNNGVEQEKSIDRVSFTSFYSLSLSKYGVGDSVRFNIDSDKNLAYAIIDDIGPRRVVDTLEKCPYCNTALYNEYNLIKCINEYCFMSPLAPILNMVDIGFKNFNKNLVLKWVNHFPMAGSKSKINNIYDLFHMMWNSGKKGTSSRTKILVEEFGIEETKIIKEIELFIENKFNPYSKDFGFTLFEFLKICSFKYGISDRDLHDLSSNFINVIDFFSRFKSSNISDNMKESIELKTDFCNNLVDIIPLRGFNEGEYTRKYAQFFRICRLRNNRSSRT